MKKRFSHRAGIWVTFALPALCLLGMILYPEPALQGGREALSLCAQTVIPALFPYFVLTSLLLRTEGVQALCRRAEPLTEKLFGVPGAGACALLFGLLGGYPVGARTAAELYDRRRLTREETEHLLGFCSNSGPAFIFGIVGTAVVNGIKNALLVWLAHILGTLCTGLLLRSRGTLSRSDGSAPPEEAPLPSVFAASVVSGASAICGVCGFVVIFSVLLRLAAASGLWGLLCRGLGTVLPREWCEPLLTGTVELSSGVWSLARSGLDTRTRMLLASFLLGWGGLSVHCQTMAVCAGRGLRLRRYFSGKLLHGILSAVFILLLTIGR